METQEIDEGELLRNIMFELRPDRPVDPAHVLRRLADWQQRTHELYDFIIRTLGQKYKYDRTEKTRSGEDMVERSGLPPDQVPAIDLLRIQRHDETVHAVIVPDGLWIVGANGRLNVRIFGRNGTRQRRFFLVDRSMPLSGAAKASWFIVSPLDILKQAPLTEQHLHELIDE